MNHLRQLCAVLALLCALTTPGRAGDVSCGAAAQPCRTAASAEEPLVEEGLGTTGGVILESMLSLLQGALTIF